MMLVSTLFTVIFSFSTLPKLSSARAGIHDRIDQLVQQNSKLLKYPTQFTQEIIPKSIHSHNDYWREVPLLTALSYGVSSVEADVWLLDNSSSTLYVAHEAAAITSQRTFTSLYVDPLFTIVSGQNPNTPTAHLQSSLNGVWDTNSGRTLQLLVDLKTAGDVTMHAAVKALKPLADAGYLTTWNGTVLKKGPITVVGTGNTNLAGVLSLPLPRYYFLDAPLANLSSPEYVPEVSPLASTSWQQSVGWNGLGTITNDQLSVLRSQIGVAKEKGIAARYWECPLWPIRARNAVWNLLIDEGIDWVNADDLEAASLL